ncbi:unnamed protein product [Didymodactylos carnosus]|uniref:Uncharacterized protein n=1 Tax=Didymodactylos carnosus TaxID=1234261 RepID=A0A816D3B6_9BILA|nr:unnamed protein product [Didymodactylos carnosus]CAF1630369.1 unnamed protein product [Didymodactylos carnosus]CAF4379368.1 unnamed protein product [Didymodactylos carnosus]CAF4528663.1 unnamed protein product [Didymodactylos carnosus]
MKIKINLDDLLLNKDKCENTIYLLYKNMNLRTNINFLNDIDTVEKLDVNDFIQNVKNLYEKLRLQKCININQNKNEIPRKKIDLNESDYNKKICVIYLISRQINDIDEMQIKNGYKIIVLKNNENKFTIYFRDIIKFEIRNHLLIKQNLIDILKNRKFDDEGMLSKENEQSIYKDIYKEIASDNGFIKYSTEQIESFVKLKELVNEKLNLLENNLEFNSYQYIIN